MILYFTYESRDTLKSSCLSVSFSKLATEHGTQRKIRNRNLKIFPSWFTLCTQRRIWLFDAVVLQRTAIIKKCSKNYTSKCAVIQYCSLIPVLLSDVSVSFVVKFLTRLRTISINRVLAIAQINRIYRMPLSQQHVIQKKCWSGFQFHFRTGVRA